MSDNEVRSSYATLFAVANKNRPSRVPYNYYFDTNRLTAPR